MLLAEEQLPNKEETSKFEEKWDCFYRGEDPYYNKAIRYDIDHIHDKNTTECC